MYIHTKKQELYFEEAIRLRYEKGYGSERISRILPIGHSTVSRWLSIFASENEGKSVPVKKKKKKTKVKVKVQSKVQAPSDPVVISAEADELKALRAEVLRLRVRLGEESLRADAYDELINVAESRFKIAIRKKAGAKR